MRPPTIPIFLAAGIRGAIKKRRRAYAGRRFFILANRLIVFAYRLHAEPDTTLLVNFQHLDLDHLAF